MGAEQAQPHRNGKYHATEVDVTQWVTILGHPRSVLDNLLMMLRQKEDGFVLQRHGLPLPDQLHTLIRHETTAQIIRNVELTAVPGLLQTKAYAETLMRAEGLADEDLIQARVEARIARQSMFNRLKQPECTFYIHEFALRLPVGDSRVMNDQIMHLAFMANTYGVSIRVIPASLGPHAGMTGAFMRMDYANDDHLPIVYVEYAGASIFLDEQEVLDEHAAILKRLDRTAMDEGQSRLWLVKLASEFDPLGDDPMPLDFPTWRKSSYTTTSGGNCVEVAFGETVALRDSKDPAGPIITISPAAWRAFLSA